MTTYGVIADIHGNLPALREALAYLRSRVDRIVCLGDIVGYNPDANECARALREAEIESIRGNHDLIALGTLGFDRCGDKPAFTLRKTRRDITDATRRYLASLPATREYDDGDFVLVHGGLEDVCQYMTSTTKVRENHRLFQQLFPGRRVCFFGHTHDQVFYEVSGHEVRERRGETRVVLGRATLGNTFFVNPGSIDGSRKDAPRFAEFATYDSADGALEFHRVPYDYESVERRATARGYRMTRLDAWAYRTARRVRRKGQALAERLYRTLESLPFEVPR